MTKLERRITKDFENAVGTPANLQIIESGLTGQAIKISLPEVIKSAAEKSDLTIIGDTNHFDVDIRRDAMSKNSLISMAEAGVTHLFVEVDQTLQHLVDDLIKNKDSPDAKEKFSRAFFEEYGNSTGNESGLYTRQLVDTILIADKLGIKVHFANPANGRQEINIAEEYAQKHPDDKDGIRERYEIANKARFNDPELAGFIKHTSKNEKSVLIYGSKHGSRFEDFEKFYDGSTIKIDVYSKHSDYIDNVKTFGAIMSEDMRFNEDKPELVYFREGQIALPTYNTPHELLKSLSEKGKLIDVPALKEGSEINNPSLQKNDAPNQTHHL